MVAATGYTGKTLEAIRDLLANCAAFRTMMSVATVAAAQDAVVMGFVRGSHAPPSADAVFASAQDGQDTQRTIIRPTAVAVTMTWQVDKQTGDTAQDIVMRAFNLFDDLTEQARALIGTGTYLMRASMDLQPPSYAKGDNTELVDHFVAGISFSWEV